MSQNIDILQRIASHTMLRVEVQKQNVPLELMISCALDKNPDTGFPFEAALSKPGLRFICECKKASPSKGVIDETYDYKQIATDYRNAKADCISVLTEPHWFMGSTKHLQEIVQISKRPVIRKDFVIDEYMIYEAKTLGASCVLLICSLLDEKTLKSYLKLCDSLGLSALVEAHDENEIDMALSVGARIIGVNNRNLRDFSVDLSTAANLRNRIPKDVLFVAESGIHTPEDADYFRKAGADAVLVGESLMRSNNRPAFLAELRGE